MRLTGADVQLLYVVDGPYDEALLGGDGQALGKGLRVEGRHVRHLVGVE